MLQPDQLKAILNTIESTSYADVQSIELLMEFGFKLQQWMAFSGEQMSVAKEHLHTQRRQKMINLAGNLKANGAALSATLQKDFINDSCATENAFYELASRTNSSCIHAIDLVRSCISAMKEELKMANVQMGQP